MTDKPETTPPTSPKAEPPKASPPAAADEPGNDQLDQVSGGIAPRPRFS